MPSNAANPEGRPPLLAQLRADQSQRWGQGERVPVESYLKQHPELLSDPNALLELVYAEVLLRLDAGDTPTLDEYLSRFPAQADHLRRRWVAHRILADQGPTVDPIGTVAIPRAAGRSPLPQLPGYEVLEELGKGGMGIVFKARQLAFDRLVAIKMIRAPLLAGTEEMRRFRTEALAAGRLDHPHVVRVFAFDEVHGCPFFVMEYLPGGTLAKRLFQSRLEVRQAVEMVRQVARGVQAAHEAGVLHRDLKPANVLLDGQGNAHVADFGLARLLDSDIRHTASEALLGTPAYMAPEQAAGHVRQMDRRADVWALGIILYECMAGHPPFLALRRSEVLQRIQRDRPPSLRKQRPDVPRELEAICLRCLEKQPANRYASAAALADDLSSWLEGRPCSIQPEDGWKKLERRLWQRPMLSLAVLGLLLGSLALLAAGPRQSSRPEITLASRLGRGQGVVLIGDTGLPGNTRWLSGYPPAQLIPGPDGICTLHANQAALLELLEDCPCERYRLSAEIRHDTSADPGSVGVFLAARQGKAGGRTTWHFMHLAFNDVVRESARWLQLPEPVRRQVPKPPDTNPVFLRSRSFIPVPGKVEGGSALHTSRVGDFLPFGHAARPGLWRKVVIEVDPPQLRVSWSGGELVCNLDLNAHLRALQFPGEKTLRPSPRGGLGLFVVRGSASFRRVRLDPLLPQAQLP
jgi:serine/threonine-protein kinase